MPGQRGATAAERRRAVRAGVRGQLNARQDVCKRRQLCGESENTPDHATLGVRPCITPWGPSACLQLGPLINTQRGPVLTLCRLISVRNTTFFKRQRVPFPRLTVGSSALRTGSLSGWWSLGLAERREEEREGEGEGEGEREKEREEREGKRREREERRRKERRREKRGGDLELPCFQESVPHDVQPRGALVLVNIKSTFPYSDFEVAGGTSSDINIQPHILLLEISFLHINISQKINALVDKCLVALPWVIGSATYF